MWEYLQQRWQALPNDWRLAFVVLIMSSVIFPTLWQIIKVALNLPNFMYKRAIIKLHDARIDWFQAKGPQAPVPTDDDLISWCGAWSWLAKRALKARNDRIVTGDFRD